MTTAQQHCIEKALHVSLELSSKEWKLAFGVSSQLPIQRRCIPSGDIVKFHQLIDQMKRHYGLGVDSPVRTCYEAGRDGFWIHRALTAEGLHNLIVDAASIQVDRRAKRAKTDRLDAAALVRLLMRHWQGEQEVWRMVQVITPEQEAGRHQHREDIGLAQERTALLNEMRGLLAAVGGKLPSLRHLGERLPLVKQWNGQPLSEDLQVRLKRLHARLVLVEQQRQEVRTQRERRLKQSDTPENETARRLLALKGIGPRGSSLLAYEGISYRQFKNRREIAGFVGITPTPYQSGDSRREQGISKAGNRWMRWMMVELAWCWLQYQPQSELSRWYRERFSGSARQKKVGIVALARKLLIALWRWVTTGELPAGAVTTEWQKKLSHHRSAVPAPSATGSRRRAG